MPLASQGWWKFFLQLLRQSPPYSCHLALFSETLQWPPQTCATVASKKLGKSKYFWEIFSFSGLNKKIRNENHLHPDFSLLSLMFPNGIYTCKWPSCDNCSAAICFYGWGKRPGDLPHPGTEPGSPVSQADSLLTEPPEKPRPFKSFNT